jgi:hypothetical protein
VSLPSPPQPNVPALLARLRAGDAGALPALRDAAPPEAEGPAEEWVRARLAAAGATDEGLAHAIALLVRIEASGCASVVARALGHADPRVQDEAARAMGEWRYYPAIDRLRACRTDAALEALEKMFQRTWKGGFWADLTGRPRRGPDGTRDWGEFDAWWEDNPEQRPEPPLAPEECTADRKLSDFLDRLPGAHRVLERHGYRCVARYRSDLEECVAVTQDSVETAARLHARDAAPLLADLAALAERIRREEAPPPAPVDEVKTLE